MSEMLKSVMKRAPLMRLFIESRLCRAMRYWMNVWRYKMVLRTSDRAPHEAFTRFCRTPSQLPALLGPTFEFLDPSNLGRPLNIVVLACSTGAEPYSIASSIVNERSDVAFKIVAGDINPELVERCQQGLYTKEEVFSNESLSEKFISQTFVSENESGYRVRPNIKEHVTFSHLDALDPNLVEKTGKADILFLQNVLLNIEPKLSSKMFANMLPLLNEKAVVFIDGVDLEQRTELTKRHGLRPLDYQVQQIHDEVWRIRKDGWPGLYWGVEPYWPHRKDALRRYATIYLR